MTRSLEEWKRIVSSYLPADSARYKHTMGVFDLATRLSENYGEDPVTTGIAALLHDIAKHLPAKRIDELIETEYGEDTLREWTPPTRHALAGAILAKTELGVDDPSILDAIRYHTTGRPAMSTMEKIVYVADYAEENRTHVDPDFRAGLFKDLDGSVRKILGATVKYLAQTNQDIMPLTLTAYRYYHLENGGME